MSQFVTFHSCDLLSKMNIKEQEELKQQLLKYKLDYRDTIKIDSNTTFGIEIEVEYNKGENFYKELSSFYEKGWSLEYESTLVNGDEMKSPILRGNDSWNDLKEICNVLKQYYTIKKTCGGHIHIGTQVLGDKKVSWQNFCKLWTSYENIIYRFTAGEYLNTRKYAFCYAKPLAKDIQFYKQENEYHIQGLFTKDKGVSFKNVKGFEEIFNNTIEFRCPNGTLEPVVWQNNIQFFLQFLNYCKNSNFDYDVVNKREKLIVDEKRYHLIDFECALELADLIFHNNLDKLYFLRQYLKDGRESEIYEKSKQFIKK